MIPRRIVRHSVAAVVWANALFATRFIHIPKASIGIAPALLLDVAVLSFILFYGVICNYGWLSVWFDLLYVYLWPFVLLFKALFSVAKRLWRRWGTATAATPAAAVELQPAPKAEKPSDIPHPIVRVFGQFALLWALVAVHTNIRALAVIAVCAALFGAVRATYNLWDFIADAIDWVESLEGPFSRQLADAIKAIRESNEPEHSQKIKNAANFLKMAELVCNFLADKKRVLARITRIVAFSITVPFYVYISAVFAAVYVGIARLEGLPLGLSSSLVDSLFVPMAFTDLPHSNVIRLIAGIQAVVIGALGYNVLFRHFTSKLNRLSEAASELRRPLRDHDLMSQVTLRADNITFLPKPPASEAAGAVQGKNTA